MLAPIVLFVYNRPEHTRKTLQALSLNAEAEHSHLYIYADGPKVEASESDLKRIMETRKVVREQQWCGKVQLKEAQSNKGLAKSVIDGTSEIINNYQKVITLEDDVLVGKYFLQFMNEALNKYEADDHVFMISGYNFPVKEFKNDGSCFFLPVSTSQAWGTWQRAWSLFDIAATGYEKLKTVPATRARFNLGNSYDFSNMLITQMESDKISSWAIRFYWSMFNNNGVNLFPGKSLVKNIGWDNSGTHCNEKNPFEDKDWKEDYIINKYPPETEIDQTRFEQIKNYFRQALHPANNITSWNKIKNLAKKVVPPLVKTSVKQFLDKDGAMKVKENERIKRLQRFSNGETTIFGSKVYFVDNASYLFTYKEIFEQEIYRFHSGSANPYILDCGANIGLSVIYFKQLYPGARIVAFEPDGKVFKFLQQNMESFGFTDVQLVDKACWDEDTILQFYSEGADGGRAAMDFDQEQIVQVPAIRLRSYLDRTVDFLKIDIEGAEYKVLTDISDQLYQVKKIFVEYHSFKGKEQMLPEVMSLLKNAGFRLTVHHIGIYSPNPLWETLEYNGMDLQLNIYGSRD